MELPSSLVASQIERGSIFHSTIFEDIDHGKFFIISGIDFTTSCGTTLLWRHLN